MNVNGYDIETWADLMDFHFDDIYDEEEHTGLCFDAETNTMTLYIGELDLDVPLTMDEDSLETYCTVAAAYLEDSIGAAVNAIRKYNPEVDL